MVQPAGKLVRNWAPLALSFGILLTAGLAAGPQQKKSSQKKPPAKPAQPAPKQPVNFDVRASKELFPLLDKYCLGCHEGKNPAGGLDLSTGKSQKAILDGRDKWEKAHSNIRSSHMPPAGSPAPTAAERTKMLEILEAIFNVECSLADSGRVTIRRLNKYEYTNTIRDLLYIDTNLAEDFPSDDIGYGFDNNGDVLSTSSLLMEGYLKSAEVLADQAISIPEPLATTYDPSKMTLTQGAREADGEVSMFTNASATVIHKFKADGSYVIRVKASGQQAGPDPCRMTISVDGRVVQTFNVANNRRNIKSYEVPIEALGRNTVIGISFINDYYNQNAAEGQKDRNLWIQGLEIAGPLGTVGVLPKAHSEIIFVRPNAGQERDAAKTILKKFAGRAYRRPATDQEVDRLLKIYDLAQRDGVHFEEGIRVAVTAVLTSPNFLFRVELDDKSKTGDQPLNPYSLASRLSYFLWSSMPDAELTQLAYSGDLVKPEVLEKQIDRMLASPKAAALADRFAVQWLELERLKIRSPDPKLFPGYNNELAADMLTETKMFFTEILKKDRSILDFINGKFTYVNQRLASHYGIDGIIGPEFRRIDLTGTPRGGVLTQGSVLTVTSNPTRTSPVKRGKWVLEQILGAAPPPPPPGGDVFNEQVKQMTAATVRQQMEEHRKNPACATCHTRMDPLGFGLENFDAVGAWRTTDAGKKIDCSGSLPGNINFNGPNELQKILISKSDDFVRCLTEKVMTYALGRGMRPSDRCHIDAISAKVKKSNFKFSSLIKSVVLSDPFRKKNTKESVK